MSKVQCTQELKDAITEILNGTLEIMAGVTKVCDSATTAISLLDNDPNLKPSSVNLPTPNKGEEVTKG